MKKRLLILTSILGAIAIFIMLTAGGYEKRGINAFEAVLAQTLKKDTDLAKHLNESQAVINKADDSADKLKYLINRLENYYKTAQKKAENIQDEALRKKVQEALNSSEADFKTKKNSANNNKKSVEELITQLEDLNAAISIFATIPTQQVNENDIQEKVNTLNDKKADLKSKIKSAKEQL